MEPTSWREQEEPRESDTIMRNCSVVGTKEQEMRAWKLQFLFLNCVLRIQPEIRGGRKKKLRLNESLRAGLLERLKRWNDGEVDVLWAEACKLYSGGARQVATSLLASNARRMLGTARLCLPCFLSALVQSQRKL